MESLRAAVSVGIKLSEYNEMTPYELAIHIQEFQKYETFMQRERITAAYVGAKLERAKTIPDLQKLLDNEPQEIKRKTQDPADMLAEVIRLNAAFGGTVES